MSITCSVAPSPVLSAWHAVGAQGTYLQDDQGKFVRPHHLLTDTPVDQHGQVSIQRCEAEGLSPAGLAAQLVSKV